MMGRAKQQSTRRRELVGVADVATRLSLTAERVRQLAKSGQMPEPVGELGRRQVWDWREVEAWARSEGRLAEPDGPGDGEVRQVTRSRRNQPVGTLRLVVDELMKWGSRDSEICHIRVWSPPPDSDQGQVVLLGQLEDRAASISNSVEQVIMVAAARYLGRQWRDAQFYQYSPAGMLDDADVFLHVSFSVRDLRGRPRSIFTGAQAAAKALGAEVLDPDWRTVSVEDFEHLTGDSPRMWAAGTYTRALVALAANEGAYDIVWDPERATDLAALAVEVARSGDADAVVAGIRVSLTRAQREATFAVLAAAAATAYQRALDDVDTQRADAAIVLHPPVLPCEAQILDPRVASAPEDIDPHLVWDALTAFRQSLIDYRYDKGTAVLDRERALLAEGQLGGWVQLHWADAGVDESESERDGWGGPIALPEDLIGAEPRTAKEIAPVRAVLLLDTLSAYLADNWDDWSAHDRPIFTPSAPLSATGPLARRYLDQLKWIPIEDADQDRVRRLPNRPELTRAAMDSDGWLVAKPNRGWFVCEWPVGGPRDSDLAACRVQADRPARQGSTPVFLSWPDGRLSPLPSGGRGLDTNTYAWGYGGGGPWNLIAAVVDLLERATAAGELDLHTAMEVAREHVASPRTPDWQVSELIAEVRRRQPADWSCVCEGPDD